MLFYPPPPLLAPEIRFNDMRPLLAPDNNIMEPCLLTASGTLAT